MSRSTAAGLGKPFLAQSGLLSADGAFAATSIALGDLKLFIEDFPTSPLILARFTDALPVPKANAEPGAKFGVSDPSAGTRTPPAGRAGNETHQMWVTDVPAIGDWPRSCARLPMVCQIRDQVRTHSFTTSRVLPIDKNSHQRSPSTQRARGFPAGTE